MDSKLNLVLDLPLKEICLRRQAAFLCTEPDILSEISKFCIKQISWKYEEKCRQFVESEITNKLSKHILPKSVVKQIVEIAHFIVPQIFRWISFHRRYFTANKEETVIPLNILTKLRWTEAGIIDYSKTAEEIVCCENINCIQRYEIACEYCLDDYIPVFWKELPAHNQDMFHNETVWQMNHPPLPFCWSFILNGEQSKLDSNSRSWNGYSFNSYIFKHSASCGNKAATEYFYRKLTQEEKDNSIIKAITDAISQYFPGRQRPPEFFPWDNYPYIIIYLLSQMNLEQQMQFFKESTTEVLHVFLNWPWHDIYLQIIDHLWTSINNEYFFVVLNFMRHITLISQEQYPKKFVQEFFLHHPIAFRKQLVEIEYKNAFLFRTLIEREDSETIRVIFRNVDDEDRMKLVSSPSVFQEFLKGKWNMVKVCLHEAKLSKESRETLESDFRKFRTSDDNVCKNEQTCEKLLQLIQDYVGECSHEVIELKQCLKNCVLND